MLFRIVLSLVPSSLLLPFVMLFLCQLHALFCTVWPGSKQLCRSLYSDKEPRQAPCERSTQHPVQSPEIELAQETLRPDLAIKAVEACITFVHASKASLTVGTQVCPDVSLKQTPVGVLEHYELMGYSMPKLHPKKCRLCKSIQLGRQSFLQKSASTQLQFRCFI